MSLSCARVSRAFEWTVFYPGEGFHNLQFRVSFLIFEFCNKEMKLQQIEIQIFFSLLDKQSNSDLAPASMEVGCTI